MNINQNQNYNISLKGKGNNSGFWRNFKQKILDVTPNHTAENLDLKLYEKISQKVSHPAYNKLIIGGTGLISQPIIDNNNKNIDETTRKISVCRTIAKIIAGTAVGFIVRGGSFSIISRYANPNGKNKNCKLLIPKKYIEKFTKDSNLLNNHKNTLSTVLALAAMCITNVVADAPLTIYLTNKLTKKFNLNEEESESRKKQIKEGLYA